MTGFTFDMIAHAIARVLVDELADRIEECRACVEGVRLCAWHQTAAQRLLPGCTEPDCWTCLPPTVCGAPFIDGIYCMQYPHTTGDHRWTPTADGTVPRPTPRPYPQPRPRPDPDPRPRPEPHPNAGADPVLDPLRPLEPFSVHDNGDYRA